MYIENKCYKFAGIKISCTFAADNDKEKMNPNFIYCLNVNVFEIFGYSKYFANTHTAGLYARV